MLLDRELQKVNKVIDDKIKSHQPYKKEAALHRKIITRLARLQKNGALMAIL